MTEETALKLKSLAEKYEVASFLDEDPSQFLRWYKKPADAEVASFIAAMLSFGNRTQFIPKIKEIFKMADKSGGICKWLLKGAYETQFVSPTGNEERKFYRFYSYADMKLLFVRLRDILEKFDSLGEYVKTKYEQYSSKNFEDSIDSPSQILGKIISTAFSGCSIVPKGKNSANKRIFMFLRWMVRQNSPVDLGLWTWFDQKNLVIPLDTHVLQQSIELGLIPSKSTGTFRTAFLITQQMAEIWPDDPCKGDFALFGEGVNSDD